MALCWFFPHINLFCRLRLDRDEQRDIQATVTSCQADAIRMMFDPTPCHRQGKVPGPVKKDEFSLPVLVTDYQTGHLCPKFGTSRRL